MIDKRVQELMEECVQAFAQDENNPKVEVDARELIVLISKAMMCDCERAARYAAEGKLAIERAQKPATYPEIGWKTVTSDRTVWYGVGDIVSIDTAPEN